MSPLIIFYVLLLIYGIIKLRQCNRKYFEKEEKENNPE